MVRQAQKEGQAKASSPEVARVASRIKKSDAKDFASTKHKGLPEKKKMNEEGYDHYRDNILMKGGDHRSKETKNRSYTPSKPIKGKTAAQKAAKGKSALEIVKKSITDKYGKGAIMNLKKEGTAYGIYRGDGKMKFGQKKKEDKKKEEVKAVPADTMEGMYDIDPKTGKSPVASSVEKGNKKKGEKRLKHFAKLAKKMVGEGTVAKDMCKKNCGCGQDPCITYGEQTQKPAAARPADKVMVSELSKKTYGSYVKKAATEIGTSAMKGDYKKMQKRHKGVLDASDKLQKEELKMTKKEYSKIHKDFKSDDPKKPRTTKYVPGKGTVSMPVKFVDEAVYTGPNKEDRKQIKKMDNPSYAKKLADYEKNMDPKKRQALKDKATKGMKFTVEAMSSYDRNRKAAAKRAAARNAERRAGKRGGRMEGETYRTEGGVHMHHKGYKAEGMSYGLYKGSGKPSGPMAAFGKKNKLNKPETKKKKVQSFKKFKAGQEPASASAPDMSEATLATARKNIGRDPKKKSCWKGYKATGTKMKDGRAVPDCKPA